MDRIRESLRENSAIRGIAKQVRRIAFLTDTDSRHTEYLIQGSPDGVGDVNGQVWIVITHVYAKQCKR